MRNLSLQCKISCPTIRHSTINFLTCKLDTILLYHLFTAHSEFGSYI